MEKKYLTSILAIGAAVLMSIPSAWYNVVPHLRHWMAGEWLDDEGGRTFMAAASILLVILTPFFLRSVRGVFGRVTVLLVCVFFINLNFMNILRERVNGAESATGHVRVQIRDWDNLDRHIKGLQGERDSIGGTAASGRENTADWKPKFTRTSQAMVDAVRTAVQIAESAKAAECGDARGGRGDRCREREGELRTAQDKLSQTLAQRAATERADQLDNLILQAQKELDALGPRPKHEDALSASLVHFLAKLAPVGDDFGEEIQSIQPLMEAFGIELLALIGPYMAMLALRGANAGIPTGIPAGKLPRKTPARSPREKAAKPLPKIAAASGLLVGAEKTQLMVLPKPDSASRSTISDTDIDAVKAWAEARLSRSRRKTDELTAKELFESYTVWCETKGFQPAKQAAFGRIMTNTLGIDRVERSKRRYYVAVAWRKADLRVVSS